MIEVLKVAYEVILPILIVAGLAFALRRQFVLDAPTISRVLMYIFLPALIFNSIAHSELDGQEMGGIVLAILIFTVINVALVWNLTRIFPHFERPTRSAFLLSAVLINSGNYGLPFVEFAFGDEGLQRGVLVMVTTLTISFTLGIYLASLGKASVKESLMNVFKFPMIYTTTAGFAVNLLHIELPVTLDRAVGLMGEAAIPSMLTILGIQLAQMRAFDREHLQGVLLAISIRLIGTPILMALLTELLGIHGITQQVIIVQMSMPTAVNATVLATEFGSDADFTTTAILISTLASVATLSVLFVLVT